MLFGNMLESYLKNPTCKSINQNNSTLRTMAKHSKHTNSISLFRTQEDTILERSRTNNQNEATENNKNEHKKLPSINDILAKKIGFCSLPEVQCDDEYSNTPSARK